MSNETPKPKGKPGRKVGDTAINHPAIKALRAQAIIEDRVKGIPVATIADNYGVSIKSIYRIIRWAETEGLLAELKQRVLTRLGSMSLDVYEAAMKASPSAMTPTEIEGHKMKLTAAKDVAFGAGVLSKKIEKTETTEVHTMNWWLENRGKGEQAGEEEGLVRHDTVLDGTVVSAEEGAATTGADDEQERFQKWLESGDDSGAGEDGDGE